MVVVKMTEIKQLFYFNWKYRNYKASTFINGLFYFLGRIPFIGKIVPTTMLYREYGLKKGFTAIKLLFSLALSFLLHGIPFIISFFISKGLSDVVGSPITIFFVWLFLFNLIGSCLGELFLSLEKQEIQFIINFRVSKEDYIKRKTILGTVEGVIFSLPGLVIVGLIEKNVLLYLLIGIFSLISYSLLWSVVNLHITLIRRRLLAKLTICLLVAGLEVGLIYLLIQSNGLFAFQEKFVSWVSAFIYLIMCLPFFYLYVRFNQFDAFSRQMFASSEIMINYSEKNTKDQEYYLGEGKKMKLEKETNETDLSSLKGSKYINALLFSRFKTSLRKQLIYRIIGITVIMLMISLTFRFIPMSISEAKFEKIVYNFLPIMFFILYILSFGKKVVQTIFVNCDSSMLAYPFYRESKAIVRGFFYRFLKIFYYNGIISLTIYLGLLFFNVLNHQILSTDLLLLFLFVMISLTILFSFHELFIYYILQPFTSDFQVKNPVYKLVDGVFYGIAYMSLQIKTAGVLYALLVSGISIVYFIIGLIVIVKFAPRTFKLKN